MSDSIMKFYNIKNKEIILKASRGDREEWKQVKSKDQEWECYWSTQYQQWKLEDNVPCLQSAKGKWFLT